MAAIVAKSASVKDVVDETISKVHEDLWKLNQQIWSNPETAYQEFKAHDALCDFLESQGYKVTRHAYGLETSFEATYGSGGRLVNFNAEYDSLPGIGHACGHNLIATSSVTAFLALSQTLKALGLPGRTQLLGTPAEEGGGGKVKLIQAGALKGVDCSLMAHGGPDTLFPQSCKGAANIAGCRMLAREQIFVEFHGRAAHAGGCPWDGKNSLDAFVQAYNNVSMLRQQIYDTDRIHVAILDAPKVANVIPAYTKSVFATRSETLDGLKKLSARVVKCIKAAALSTECEVTIEDEDYYADIILNDPLCDRYTKYMTAYDRTCVAQVPDVLTGSTDQGNVSYEVPTLHSMFAIPSPKGTSIHHPSFTEVAGTRDAHEIAIIVGKTLAMLGSDILGDDSFYESTKKDWEEKKLSNADENTAPKSLAAFGCC